MHPALPLLDAAPKLGVARQIRRALQALMWAVVILLAALFGPYLFGRTLFFIELVMTAGLDSVECGHVGTRDNRHSAIACAKQALRNQQAFRVSFAVMGFDSMPITAAAVDRAGNITMLGFDSSIMGLIILPPFRVNQLPCGGSLQFGHVVPSRPVVCGIRQ